jgi:hypothetical protein
LKNNFEIFSDLLKLIEDQTGLGEKDIAVRAGRNSGYISQLRSRFKNKGEDIPPKFIELLKLRFAKELNTTDDLTQPFHQRRQIKKNAIPTNKKIPFYDAEASASNIQSDMTPIHAPAGTIDIGDLLNDSEAAIRIYGNSMIPNYPPGCVIGLAKCNSRFIEPGEVYVIETADRRVVKRLFYKNDESDSEFFTCYSDNLMVFEGGARNGKLAYPPFDLPKDLVINLFIVTGVIKRNSNSIIINRQ